MKAISFGTAFLTLAFATGTLAQISRPMTGEPWRLWGGPQLDFTSKAKDIFPATGEKWLSNPPRKIWQRALGDGYSGIAEENGILYTAYRKNDNDIIIALDSSSGNTIWEYEYPARFRNAFSESVGPGPYAMPQIVGDRIVTASGIGQIHSLDKKTGKPVWALDLYKQYGGTRLDYGYSSHALPYNDALIILAGGNGNGVLKVRQSDGSVIWKRHRLEAAHSSPVLIRVDGQPQVVILLAQEIAGIDPESGELLWRHSHPTENGLAISTPIWTENNLLFLSSAYNGGARVLKLTRSGNKTNVQELWHNRRVQSHFGSVIRQGNYVYLSSGHNVAFISAVDLQTGRIAWQVRDFVKAQLLYADGRLIIVDQDGNVGLGIATPERFQAIAKWPLLSSIAWSPPTLVGNRLYLRDRRVIMALDLSTLRP